MLALDLLLTASCSTHLPKPQVIMFGAHLDSVQAGPGINDNGVGSGLLTHRHASAHTKYSPEAQPSSKW